MQTPPRTDDPPPSAAVYPDRGLLNRTYASRGLAAALLRSMQAAGFDLERLTPEDLIGFDELHIMGRDATRALGRVAGLKPGMHILDIGCGLGGAARTLALTFGCRVTGVDLSAEFVAAAAELSRRTGLAQRVDFQVSDATFLPFGAQRFDAVFMFHVAMNIEDKPALYREARRVLKPGAPLGLWEVCAASGAPLVYPVPWSRDRRFSFLVAKDALRQILRSAGFQERHWEDATAEAQTWVQRRLAAMQRPRSPRPGPDLNLILPDFRLKRANVSRNLLAHAITLLRTIVSAPSEA